MRLLERNLQGGQHLGIPVWNIDRAKAWYVVDVDWAYADLRDTGMEMIEEAPVFLGDFGNTGNTPEKIQ